MPNNSERGALHLCFDGNFIANSIKVFGRYTNVPNVFVVDCKPDKLRFLKQEDGVIPISFSHSNYIKIKKLADRIDSDKIVIHGISPSYIGVVKYLMKHRKYKVYWIFWGFELYNSLAQDGKYNLIDERFNVFKFQSYLYPNQINKLLRRVFFRNVASDNINAMLPIIDFFCFWNYFDYELLLNNYKTSIEFKYFAYSAHERTLDANLCEDIVFSQKRKAIMINHQASLTGNHISIMEKLKEIDSANEFEKLVPLSYGPWYIRRLVLRKGLKLFKHNFTPLLTYLNRNDYFDLINSVSVAIFGARRQEASGNIYNLLRNGVKVFLRNDNTLLNYYKSKGYIIFSYENDLRSLQDLFPLSEAEQVRNRAIADKTKIFYSNFMPYFFS